MGTMTFDADTLTTLTPEPTNITLFTGSIGDIVGHEFDHALEMDVEHYETTHDQDVNTDWIRDAELDFSGAYKAFADELPDMLQREFPELFVTDRDDDSAPVFIGNITEVDLSDPGGWGRETIMAPLEIDGDALKALADEHGITEIHDGHGISGFFRTADDKFWAQLKVIEEIMSGLDPCNDKLLYAIGEMESSMGFVSNFITYPEEYTRALCES